MVKVYDNTENILGTFNNEDDALKFIESCGLVTDFFYLQIFEGAFSITLQLDIVNREIYYILPKKIYEKIIKRGVEWNTMFI